MGKKNHTNKKQKQGKKVQKFHPKVKNRLKKIGNRISSRISRLERDEMPDRAYIEYLTNLVRPGTSSCLPYFNEDCPVQDVIPLRLECGAIVDSLDHIGVGKVKLGVTDYTLLTWTPSMTMLGDTWQTTPGSGLARMSGLCIIGHDDVNHTFTATEMLGINLTTGQRGTGAYTQKQLFGSDFSDIGQHGATWAASLHLSAVIAEARLTGQYWTGTLTLGQLVDQDGSFTGSSTLTIGRLIQQADEIASAKGGRELLLQAVIRNPAILTSVSVFHSDDKKKLHGQFLDEMIHYIILPKFNMGITEDGKQATYQFVSSARLNAIVWPKITAPSKSLSDHAREAQNLQRQEKVNMSKSDTGVLKSLSNMLDNPVGKAIKMAYHAWKLEPAAIGDAIDLGRSLVSTFRPSSQKAIGAPRPKLAITNYAHNSRNEVSKTRWYDFSTIEWQLEYFKLDKSSVVPEVDALLKTINASVDSLKEYISNNPTYYYPPPNYNPPEHYVIPGDVLATNEKLASDQLHPDIISTPDTPFTLRNPNPWNEEWFNKFLMLFKYGKGKDSHWQSFHQ